MKNDNTKIIDQYLSGELSDTERIDFEKKLESNAELQKELELQRNIYEGAKRANTRNTVKSVGKKHHLINLTKWIIGGIAVIALIVSAVYFSMQLNSTSEKERESTTQLQIQLKSKELIKDLPREVFTWSGEDTVYLSKSGVLISVPNKAILQNGQPYKGKAIIEWQEAVDGATIMKSGLSTMADSNLLETQGMFSFRVQTENGDLLQVDPEVGIYVQVPVDEIKPGMQLYDGKYDKDSVINWVNPVPLEKIPIPVDMSELDFYPKGYEDTLDKLKLSQEKEYRDSLYLVCEFVEGNTSKYQDNNDPINEYSNVEEIIDNKLISTDTFEVVGLKDSICYDIEPHRYIPPSSVLAFWNEKFNNTILATRDFEKRMRVIHETCDESLLKLYTSNLDQPLYFIDSLAVARGYKQFESFFAERVGKMELSNYHLKNLKNVYEKGMFTLREDLKKQRTEYEKNKISISNKLIRERVAQAVRTSNMMEKSLAEETRFNLKQKPVVNQQTVPASFVSSTALVIAQQRTRSVGFRINNNNAVCNVDRKVANATRSRSNFRGSYQGKSIDVKYNNFKLSVENHSEYSRLYVYLLPDKFSSYQRLSGSDGEFSYRMNDKVLYNVVVIGFNQNEFFYYEKQNINRGSFNKLKLNSISESKFEKKIAAINSSRLNEPSGLMKDLKWLKLEKDYYKLTNEVTRKNRLLKRMRKVVFPCMPKEIMNSAEKPQTSEEVITPFVSQSQVVDYPALEAEFPGGVTAMKQFISENINYPNKAKEEGVQGEVFVGFNVEANGLISNVHVVRGVSPEIDNEAIRVVRSMPKWTPAQNEGNVRSLQRIRVNFILGP